MSNPVNDSGTDTYFRAETVPARKYQPNLLRRDIRGLERRIAASGREWPASLNVAAGYALLALKTLDQPNVPDVLMRAAASDLIAFNEAHAKHAAPHPE